MTDVPHETEAVAEANASRSEARGDGSRRVRPAFLVTFLGLLAALCVVTAASWDTSGGLALRRFSDSVEHVRTAFWQWRFSLRDPRPGSRLAPSRGLSGVATRDAIEVVVFSGGGLSCCGGMAAGIVGIVRDMAQKAPSGREVRWTLVVGQDDADLPAEALAKSAGLFSLVRDRRKALAERFNAYFAPRAYILRGGALVWAQPAPAEEELLPVRTIIEHVRRVAEAPAVRTSAGTRQ